MIAAADGNSLLGAWQLTDSKRGGGKLLGAPDRRRSVSDDRHSSSPIRIAVAVAGILAVATRRPGFAADSAAAALIGKAGAIELTGADVGRMVISLPDATPAKALASDPTVEQLVRNERVRRLAIADARAKGFDRDLAVSAELERLRDEVVARLRLDRETPPAADDPAESEIELAYDDRAGAPRAPRTNTSRRFSRVQLTGRRRGS